MNEEKRGRMVINPKDVPNDVYEILNKKASRRALTPFIVELVREKENTKLVLEKLRNIEDKIDRINSCKTVKNENYIEPVDEALMEGVVVENIKEVIGGIDQEDKVDYDF